MISSALRTLDPLFFQCLGLILTQQREMPQTIVPTQATPQMRLYVVILDAELQKE